MRSTENHTEKMANHTNGNINGDAFPKWLNASFFADVLKKQFGKYELLDMRIEAITSKGENYTSAMHKVAIDVTLPDGRSETVNYLTKSSLETDLAKKMMGDMSLFPKETEMYEKIVPQMETLYKQLGLDVSIGAKCAKVQQSPPVIVLEDLKVKNYANINRVEGMDLAHAEASLEKLAQWHAATARIYELRGSYSDSFNESFVVSSMEPIFEGMFQSMWPKLKESILSWGDCEKYLDTIEYMQRNFIPKMREMEEVNRLEFNVLNHGDAWCNNIMFKHNEDGSIADVKLVDLQMCRWGSPAQDLQYFIMSSCNYDIRISKFDYFIRHYHRHLVRYLKIVKYSRDIPTLIDLHADILKRGFFSYMAAFTVLSGALLDPNENASMDNFISESEAGNDFRQALYRNPRYIKAVKQILPFLENRGVLDI